MILCLLLRMINEKELQTEAITIENGGKTGCQSRYMRYIIVPSFEHHSDINCITECSSALKLAEAAPDVIMSSEVRFHNFPQTPIN